MLLTVGIVATGVLVLLRLVGLRRISSFNPVWYFSVINWLMIVGSLALLDLERSEDVRHAWVLIVSSVVYSVSATVTLRVHGGIEARSRDFWTQPTHPMSALSRSRLRVLLLVSGAVSVVYFFLIGYNVFLVGISDAITGNESDFTTLRLQSYAGDRYFAPGYVNQFKNAIFPLSVALLWHDRRTAKQGQGWRWILPIVAMIFLVGAGQRGAFVLSILMVLLFAQGYYRRKRTVRQVIVPVSLAFTVFSLLSFLQGRFAEGTSVLGSAFGSAWDRAFHSNQSSSVAGFRIVSELPIVNGREWLDAGLGLLPGHSGSDLSSIVYQELFGGTRGTSPVSVWGSFWHNGGWYGVIVGAVLLGWVHGAVYRRLLSGQREPVRLMAYAATVVLLSTWVAGSFTYVLNNGLLGIGILVLVLKERQYVEEQQSTESLTVVVA